jgi:hypothetical protein
MELEFSGQIFEKKKIAKILNLMKNSSNDSRIVSCGGMGRRIQELTKQRVGFLFANPRTRQKHSQIASQWNDPRI